MLFYLDKTNEWLEDNYVEDDRTAFMCCFLTCIWVSHMRDEPITYIELMELLGVDYAEDPEEKVYELDKQYADLEHEELLKRAVGKLGDSWDD